MAGYTDLKISVNKNPAAQKILLWGRGGNDLWCKC